MYRTIAVSNVHPSSVSPYRGLFNHRSFKSLVKYEDINLEAVVPRPIAPSTGPFSKYSSIPQKQYMKNYTAYYPTFLYLLPKKLFKYTITQQSYKNNVNQFLRNNFDIPDVIHAGHILFDGYGSLPYCKDHDVPLTVMGRGYLLNNFHSLSNSTQKKIKSVLDYSSSVICVSNDLAQTAATITEQNKIHVVPNGTEPDLYPLGQKENIRRQLSIPEDHLVVLFVGSFTARKGINDIIKMVKNTASNDIYFLFVGHHGDFKQELISECSKSAYNNKFKLYSGLPPFALRQLYAASDVLLLPSYAEGRPNVIYEALASKTAVVASDIPGIDEQVIDQASGLLFEPGNWQRMHNQLIELRNDRRRAEKIGKKGFKRLHQKRWLWSEHANRINGIFTKII